MTERSWYQSHQNLYPRPRLPDVKIVGNHFGYLTEAPYEDIEKYDLRFVDRCTTDELYDRFLGVDKMILEVLKGAVILVLALVVVLSPILVSMIVAAVWDNSLLEIAIVVGGYAVMLSAFLTINTSDLTGTGEVVGMEHIPAHSEKTVKTRSVFVNGEVKLLTTPADEYKEETYVIHVRQKTDSKYKRYMLEVDEEEFEEIELGKEVSLDNYEVYD